MNARRTLLALALAGSAIGVGAAPATAAITLAPVPLASVPPACGGGAGWCPYSTTWVNARVKGTDCYMDGRLELSHKFMAKWKSTTCQNYTARLTAYAYNRQSGWSVTDSTLLLNTTTTVNVGSGYHICYVYIALYLYGAFAGDLVYYRNIVGSNSYPYML